MQLVRHHVPGPNDLELPEHFVRMPPSILPGIQEKNNIFLGGMAVRVRERARERQGWVACVVVEIGTEK